MIGYLWDILIYFQMDKVHLTVPTAYHSHAYDRKLSQ